MSPAHPCRNRLSPPTAAEIVRAAAPGQPQPIIFANDAFLRAAGYARHELLGGSMTLLIGPETDRAEAARIAGQARAGSASAMSAPSGRHEREAVNAFITREREFLQSLAGLVQSHAETVKSMAKTSRAAPSQSVPRPSSSPSSAAPATSSASAAPSRK